jgi:hypothetical protein
MAKKASETVVEEPKGAPIIHVDLATSEEDTVAYDQAGAKLVFVHKRFRSLKRENLEALSHDNQVSYRKAVEEMKNEADARKPAPRPQVIDPLGGHEGALLDIKVTDPVWAKKWHTCWKHVVEQESLARVGYSPVRAGEDPIECGLKPAGSSFILKDPRDRKDLDLILMKVAMTRYLQHMTAVAEASRDKVRGLKEKFAQDVEEDSRGKLKGLVEEGPPEEVSLRRSDLRPA